MRSIAMILLLSSLGMGCGSTAARVPISGSASDVSQLAGEWNGEYHADTGGRSGVVTFQLAAGRDTASGDVIMFAKQDRPGMSGNETRNTGPNVVPQGLSIRFVRTREGMVSGALDPYRDPECDCMVSTTFEGRLSGDTIEGRYISARSGEASPVRGTWKVKRKS